MKIRQFEVWIADLNPRSGTEAGKVRPVVIVQSDLLNDTHPSSLICPLTTNIQMQSDILRVHLLKGMANVQQDCDVIVDQLRAIDNRRLQNRLGKLPDEKGEELKERLKIMLDLMD